MAFKGKKYSFILTKGYVVHIDEDIYEKYKNLKWYASISGKGNAHARRNNPTEYLHHLVLGRKPNKDEKTIFKDGNSMNCTRENLEIVKKKGYRFKEGFLVEIDGVENCL